MTKYDLAAQLTMEGLDGYYGKLPAQRQRALFGKAVFGKKTIRINCDNQGTVEIYHPCWEGTHTSYAIETLSFEALCRHQ
jgi:hypothetical protein